jgi:hypothetical protein
MSTQYRLVQSGKTASGGCSAGPRFVRAVAPRIYGWCSVVVSVMFNTLTAPTIVSERTAKNKKKTNEGKRCGKAIYFELFGENCMEIIITGHIFIGIMNYQGFRKKKTGKSV